MDILRQPLTDLNISTQLTKEDMIDRMVSYFDRQDDHEQIRSAVKTRYGTGIKSVVNPNNPKAIIETYAKVGITEMIDAGIFETLSVGFGNKIIDARATLFTEKGQNFSLSHETVEDVSKAEYLINMYRDVGGYKAAMTELDRRAVQCGSAAMLISMDAGNLAYQVFAPGQIRPYFADYIEADGDMRPVDKTQIEDATAVVIRLNQVDIDLWNYVAIYGRSEEWPDGRYVMYQASRASVQIPDKYAEGAIEYDALTGEGRPCNPLSYLANQYPDLDIPEYPIVIFDGGTTYDGTLLPVTSSLYDDCLEFDTMASHLMACATDAASGTKVFERDAEGASKPLPRAVTGVMDLPHGITFRYESHDAGASETAFEVMKGMMVQKAASYSVPDYMVTSEDHTVDASSGIALSVKTRPLKKDRERRAEVATPRVKDGFNIEKSLIKLFGDETGDEELLFGCTQSWEAGELKLPENKKEASERISVLMDRGIFDMIAGIKEWYQFTTDEEAIEMYKTMQDRKAEFPPLNEPVQKKQVGLLRGQPNRKV